MKLTLTDILAAWLLLFAIHTSVVASDLSSNLQQASSPEIHVFINEFMASNGSTIADEDGDYEDWIELYNAGSHAVELMNWTISDDLDRPERWVFPDITIEPGGFLLLWASGKNRRTPDGELHTNFSISRSGEPLLLSDAGGNRVDYIDPVVVERDVSYGRTPDGADSLVFFSTPTPGYSNSEQGTGRWPDPPIFSHTSGFYTVPFDLYLTPGSHPESATILYTLDGSLPDPAHLDTTWYPIRSHPDAELQQRPIITREWQGSLHITNRTNQENDLSRIVTTYGRHRDPAEQLPKATVIRAAVYQHGVLSPVKTATFFVGAHLQSKLSLPIFSVTAPEEALFGYEQGILVPGRLFDYSTTSLRGGNYMMRGEEWEREAHVHAFFSNQSSLGASSAHTPNLILDQALGLRVHGGTSRHYTHKSLRLYARAGYGESWFNHALFPGRHTNHRPVTRFKRLMLRNSGQDISSTFFRDGLISTLMTGTQVDVHAFQPSHLFINGEYWGLANLRERFDRYYVQEHYGVDEQHVSILESWEETDAHYAAFRSFLEQADPKQASFFTEVAESIHPLSLFDMRIADIYFGRWDIHHWRLWRDRSDPSSRWRWNLWDMDLGLGLVNDWGPAWTHGALVHTNYLERFLTDFHSGVFNRELQLLLKNEQGKELFINRFADLMNTRFHRNRVHETADSLQNLLATAMPGHIARWRPPSGIESMATWEEEVQLMREFASERADYVRGHIDGFFDLGGPAHVTLAIHSAAGPATITLNTLDLELSHEHPWQGIYFAGNALNLRAHDASVASNTTEHRYFYGWELNGELISRDKQLRIYPLDGMVLTAVYEATQTSAEPDSDNSEMPFPARTQLMHNYPNPFNASTILPFELAEDAQVLLEVFDLTGRTIATLVNAYYSAGMHSVPFKAGHLASGIYVYRLQVGGQVFVRRMILTK